MTIECPRCKSENIKTAGTGWKNIQRYACRDCWKTFQLDKPKKTDNLQNVCPTCNNKIVKIGKSPIGRQRYLCRECDKTFYLGNDKPKIVKTEEPTKEQEEEEILKREAKQYNMSLDEYKQVIKKELDEYKQMVGEKV